MYTRPWISVIRKDMKHLTSNFELTFESMQNLEASDNLIK